MSWKASTALVVPTVSIPLTEGVGFADLAAFVFGYDILVLVPEGRPSTEIR